MAEPAVAPAPVADPVQEFLDELPRHVDISCVQAEHTRADVEHLAAAAREHGFVSAHALPCWVPVLHELLDGSGTLVGSPVGFPSGGSTTATKVAEAAELLRAGVGELDVVVAVGRLRSGELRYVTDELRAVAEVVGGAVPLRAILEVGRLDDDQIRAGVDCALEAGVPWIKTGTGWSGVPTTVDQVELIAARARGRAAVKAAGGVRDLTTVRAMVRAGAGRFGMNATTAVAVAAAARGSGGPR
ncbi:deoxyribose-phosphate aldolase [Kineococcus sp. SYSU DK018]|uniref:deoxyribose-phosphate aldolase n=1 Tax=Kineococcus sp. SYSU DK018 TaxID=3383139 RepID=UPI003D7D43D7